MSRSSFLFAALLLSVQLQGITQAASVPRGLPQRTIAGVNVVDTQIVRDAHDFVLEHSTSWLYKHVMRSWLFGALIINHNETLRQSVDLEAHAIGALLHDLGWDLSVDSPFVSEDKRFEVDGAIAARQFVRNHEHGRHWDETRVQQVWDSIALHTMASIYNYKEPVVKTVGNGIYTDFAGPLLGIEQSEFKSVVDEFPNTDMADGYNSTLIWLCQHKPLTTIDNFIQPWGEHYVSNYTTKGLTIFDQTPVFFPTPDSA